jgi:hypothetical protein
MKPAYRFLIQPVRGNPLAGFQVLIGMEDDAERDFIPLTRTAFASRFPMQAAHASIVAAQLELSRLRAWLKSRYPAVAVSAGDKDGNASLGEFPERRAGAALLALAV